GAALAEAGSGESIQPPAPDAELAGDDAPHAEGAPVVLTALTELGDEEPIVEGMLPRPVFYDEERRRWPYFMSAAAIGMALLSLGVGALLASLFALRFMPHAPLPKVNVDRDVGNREPGLAEYRAQKKEFIKKSAEKTLNIRKLHEADAAREAIRHDRRRRASEFEKKAVAIYGPAS